MRVVIVGGGVGGLACAQRLARRGNDVEVELIDLSLRHDFAPSFPWLMIGRRRADHVSRSLRGLAPLGVGVSEAEVEGLDAAAGVVATSGGEVAFDRLVLAPGAALAPEAIPGLGEAAHGFYTRESAERLREALTGFRGGRVLIVVASMPFKCPAAPYEAAFLIDALLRQQGIAAKVDIVTAEPQPMPVAGPKIGAQVAAMLAERGIGFEPGRKLAAVDAAAREARFGDGSEPYDLLVAVPPHRAPTFVAESDLAGPDGWIPVDRSSFTVTDALHAIGDVAAIKLSNGMPLPKAGVFAHAAAEVVADNLAAEAAGRTPAAAFDGHGSCFLETGGGRAGFASGDFYAEPAPRVRMRSPARHWHWGKLLFERRWLSRLPRRPPEARSTGATRVLVIVNDQPYGSERPYNALRLAGSLAKRDDVELRVFLFGDAVACAVAGQQLPEGHYHLDRMLKPLVRRGEVGCCGTCLDARGIKAEQLVAGARRSSLAELTDWVLWADRALTF